MIGRVFGSWTVLSETKNRKARAKLFVCLCACGKEEEKVLTSLKNGRSTQCKECRKKELSPDYSGQHFNHWLVLERVTCPTKHQVAFYKVQCACGNISEASIHDLKRNKSTRCFDCYKRDGELNPCYRHGKHDTPEYSVWIGMHERCRNKNHKSYKWYGGRGIKVSERWSEFKSFSEDMGTRPTDKHEIDRIDNDGDYEPDNCRWVTHRENIHNQGR